MVKRVHPTVKLGEVVAREEQGVQILLHLKLRRLSHGLREILRKAFGQPGSRNRPKGSKSRRIWFAGK